MDVAVALGAIGGWWFLVDKAELLIKRWYWEIKRYRLNAKIEECERKGHAWTDVPRVPLDVLMTVPVPLTGPFKEWESCSHCGTYRQKEEHP